MNAASPPEFTADAVERARKIKLLLMDVDGVMTDGRLYYFPGPDGAMVETKGFNSQDGIGLRLCEHAGIVTGVISGRSSPATVERARILKMKYVYQGFLDKIACWEEALADAGLTDKQAAFIGDDLTDLPLMTRCGLAVAVANARPEVKEHAHFVTTIAGGNGAVREAIELILKAQGLWESMVERYASAKPLVR